MATMSRRMLVEHIRTILGANSTVVLDEFETVRARHICPGSKGIILLDKEFMNVVLPNNVDCINVDYFLCRRCGKLYLNKNSVTIVGGSQVVHPVPSGIYGGMMGTPNYIMPNLDSRVAMNDVNPEFMAFNNMGRPGFDDGFNGEIDYGACPYDFPGNGEEGEFW